MPIVWLTLWLCTVPICEQVDRVEMEWRGSKLSCEMLGQGAVAKYVGTYAAGQRVVRWRCDEGRSA